MGDPPPMPFRRSLIISERGALARSLRSVLAAAPWFALALLFTLLLISGMFAQAFAIPSLMIGIFLALRFMERLSILWLVGTPSIFIYANNVLGSIPFLRVERALLLAMLAALAARHLIERRPLRPLISLEKAMLVVLMIFGTSMTIKCFDATLPAIKENIVLFISGFGLPYGMFMIVRQLRWSDREIDLLLNAMMPVGIYLFACGVLYYYYEFTFFYPNYYDPPIEGRASGPFIQPPEYGLVMGVLMLLALYQYGRHRDSILRLIYVLLAGMFAVGLILCSTRSPWLGIGSAIVVIGMRDKSVRGILTLGAAAAAIAGCGLFFYTDGLKALSERTTDIVTMYPRVAAYATATNVIMHNPIFGLGFGRFSYFDSKHEYATTFGLVSQYWTTFAGVPHNDYLHILALTGIVGFTAFILVVVRVFRTAKLGRQIVGRHALLADYARAIVIAWLMTGLMVDTVFFQYFLSLMFFVLGVVASRAPALSPAPNDEASDVPKSPLSL